MASRDLEDLEIDPDVREAIRRFVSEAHDRSGNRLEKVVLFGSWARGEAGKGSDVDLLVLWAGPEGEAIRELTPITTQILIATGVDLAIHPISPQRLATIREADTYFYRNLTQEGVAVA